MHRSSVDTQKSDQNVNARSGLNRRTFLGILGLGVVAAGTGCQSTGSAPLIASLPEGNPLDNGYGIPTMPPKGNILPPPGPAQTNSWGIILRSAWARGGPDSRVVGMGDKKLITF